MNVWRQVTKQPSESTEGKKEETEEPPLVDVAEIQTEEPKSEKVISKPKVEEENVAPEETEDKPKEETTCTVSTTEEVVDENERSAAPESSLTRGGDRQAEQTQS